MSRLSMSLGLYRLSLLILIVAIGGPQLCGGADFPAFPMLVPNKV